MQIPAEQSLQYKSG